MTTLRSLSQTMAHTCSKIFLSLLNSLLVIFGVTLIILSFYLYNKYQSGQLIIGIIIIAFAVIFIGFLGLFGALKQSKWALSIYIVLLALITLALAGLLIVLILRESWFINQVIDNYEKLIKSSRFLSEEKNLRPIRDFVIKLDCCGFRTKNEPPQIFNPIESCQSTNGSKPLCDDQMKIHLNEHLFSIMVILGILTVLGALACLVAIHLACTN